MPAELALASRHAFPGNPASVRDARRFVADALGAGWPGLDDVLLMVSEIASNAVRHTASGTGGSFAVAVLVTGRTVRVEVEDSGGPGEPAVADNDRAAGLLGRGRGLRIVDALAEKWGYAGDGLGRVVWFESGAGDAGQASGTDRRVPE